MTGSHELDKRLARRLVSDHPLEAARVLETHDAEVAGAVLGADDVRVAASVLRQMDRGQAAACLLRWPGERRGRLLEALGAAFSARVLRVLGPTERQAIVAGCPEQTAKPIRRLLAHAEDTAGALMEPNPLSAVQDMTASQVRTRLEAPGLSSDASAYVYVVSREEKLVGVLSVRDLLRAAPLDTLQVLMHGPVERLSVRAERAAITAHPGWRQYHQLPVVERGDVLVGVIRHRALRQIEGDVALDQPDPPLVLALGEMYWTMMSRLVEGVMRSIGSDPESGERR